MRLKKGETLRNIGIPASRLDPIDRMVRGSGERIISAAKKENKKQAKVKQASAKTVLEKLNLEHQDEIERLNRQLACIQVDCANYKKVVDQLAAISILLNSVYGENFPSPGTPIETRVLAIVERHQRNIRGFRGWLLKLFGLS